MPSDFSEFYPLEFFDYGFEATNSNSRPPTSIDAPENRSISYTSTGASADHTCSRAREVFTTDASSGARGAESWRPRRVAPTELQRDRERVNQIQVTLIIKAFKRASAGSNPTGLSSTRRHYEQKIIQANPALKGDDTVIDQICAAIVFEEGKSGAIAGDSIMIQEIVAGCLGSTSLEHDSGIQMSQPGSMTGEFAQRSSDMTLSSIQTSLHPVNSTSSSASVGRRNYSGPRKRSGSVESKYSQPSKKGKSGLGRSSTAPRAAHNSGINKKVLKMAQNFPPDVAKLEETNGLREAFEALPEGYQKVLADYGNATIQRAQYYRLLRALVESKIDMSKRTSADLVWLISKSEEIAITTDEAFYPISFSGMI